MISTQHTRVAVLAAVPAILALLIFAAGCGTTNPYPAGSYERAAAYRDNDKHREAVDAYAAFLRRSPADSLAAQAQFEKALSYMEIKEYPMAAVELQILRKEYPTSDYIERAVFEEANAYFKQVGRVERDITAAYDARVRYQTFIEAYPDSPLVPEARERIIDASDIVMRKRLKQLSVYERLGRDEAIAVTLDRLIAMEPMSRLRPEAMLRRLDVALDLDDPDTAREMAAALADQYPMSEEAVRAAERVRGLADAEGS